MIQNNESVMLAIAPRTFTAVDLNGDEKIMLCEGEKQGTLLSAINRLDELNVGDIALIYNKDKCYHYGIYDIKKVDKSAVYLLNEEKNSKKLYLITCDKNDKNKRLVIQLVLNNIKSIEK